MKILSKKKLFQKAGIFGRVAPSRKPQGKGVIENPLDPLQRYNLFLFGESILNKKGA